MRHLSLLVCLALAVTSTYGVGSSGSGRSSGSSHSSGSGRSSGSSHSSGSSSHHVSTPAHHTSTPVHHTTPVHNNPTPVHHNPTPVHHNPTPVHHNPTPVKPTTPVHHHTTPTHNNPTPVHQNPTTHTPPKPTTQTPAHQPTTHTPPKPTTQTPVHVPTPVKPVSTPTPSSHGGLSSDQIHKIMPGAKADVVAKYTPHLNQAMKDAGINTPARQNAFLAQLAHESGQFRYMQELASGKAYEGRKDLGNIHPGDGEKYKGRGPIQITGRANYEAAGKALGIDLVNHPEKAATPEVGFKVAAWYWNTRHLNNLADKNTADSFSKITKAVNGCANCPQTHAAERNQFWNRANEVNK